MIFEVGGGGECVLCVGGGGGGVRLIKLPYIVYVFGQTGLSKQCRPRSDAADAYRCISNTDIYIMSQRNVKLPFKCD